MQIEELNDSLIDSLAEFYMSDASSHDILEKLEFGSSGESFAKRIANFPTWIKIYTLTEGGRIHGCVIITGADNLNLHDAAIIADLRIVPTIRGNGYATALLERALGYLRERGVKKVVTIVSEMNLAGIRLFHKAGFRAYGVFQDYYVAGENAIALELLL
jgi:ribosomal protein S18 acetylase RimI-like enzyme